MSVASACFLPNAIVTVLSLRRATNAPPVAVVATKSSGPPMRADSLARQARVLSAEYAAWPPQPTAVSATAIPSRATRPTQLSLVADAARIPTNVGCGNAARRGQAGLVRGARG